MEPKKNIIIDTRPPESTTFGFPLYLNTEIIDNDENLVTRFRANDNILSELISWLDNNLEENRTGWCIPEKKLMENKIYIDGNLVIQAYTPHLTFKHGGDLYYNHNYGNYNQFGCEIGDNGLYIDLYK